LNLDQFPRHNLLFGPSPIEALPNLSRHLGGKVGIWAKREDCNSGLAFGGNKTRKLEYLIPDAFAQGCDTLVSIGGIQSNHTREVAAVAAKVGLKCHLVQGSWVNWPDSIYDRVGNIQLSRISGAKMTFSKEDFGIEVKQSWEDVLEQVRKEGGKPYAIPAGASDHPLGGLGFTRFADEVREQEKQLGIRFDYLITGSGTGSTQAGMIVGFKSDKRSARVIGIDVCGTPELTRGVIKKIARQTAELVGLNEDITDGDITFNTEYSYPAYGIPSDETIAAINLCGRLEGMITDPVYEGKSMQAMIDMVQKGVFESGSKILYVHLGGVPALNAYASCFLGT
jgi:1-aminocyclopropane-1-carboxylate deaminase